MIRKQLPEYGIELEYKKWEYRFRKIQKKITGKQNNVQLNFNDYLKIKITDETTFTKKMEFVGIDKRFFNLYKPILKMEIHQEGGDFKVEWRVINEKSIESTVTLLGKQKGLADRMIGKELEMRRIFDESTTENVAIEKFVGKIKEIPEKLNQHDEIQNINKQLNAIIKKWI